LNVSGITILNNIVTLRSSLIVSGFTTLNSATINNTLNVSGQTTLLSQLNVKASITSESLNIVSQSLLNVSASYIATSQSFDIVSSSLLTFSSSQYKGDSASFDSRLDSITSSLQVLDNGAILGSVNSINFIGSGVNVSVGATTASVTITGGSGSVHEGASFVDNYNSATWSVGHNLNTLTPLAFAYESGSFWTLPGELIVNDADNITLQWSRVVSGSIVVINGGEFPTVISTINSATTASITHNLNTEWPLVQVYESSSRAQIIAASVVSLNQNSIELTFSTPITGKVVIKK
jgi:hypothetical protein